MKKRSSGRGAFGRSRCNRPAHRRASLGFNTAAGIVLIVVAVLGVLLSGPKAGVITAGIGGVIWGGAVLYRAQRRSLQQS